jgi:hypothetical protein
MDLEETEARNGCAGEGQQEFDGPTDKRNSLDRVYSDTVEFEPEAFVRQSPWRRRGRRSSPNCCKPLCRNVELCVRQSSASKDVNTKTDKASLLKAVTRQPVKTQQTEKT